MTDLTEVRFFWEENSEPINIRHPIFHLFLSFPTSHPSLCFSFDSFTHINVRPLKDVGDQRIRGNFVYFPCCDYVLQVRSFLKRKATLHRFIRKTETRLFLRPGIILLFTHLNRTFSRPLTSSVLCRKLPEHERYPRKRVLIHISLDNLESKYDPLICYLVMAY